jgi:hypothetical protein
MATIAKKDQPTERQKRFFERNKLQLPPTNQVCVRIIKFLNKGNPSVKGTNVFSRLNYFRKEQEKWNGKRARYRPTGEQVVIRYIVPLTTDDIFRILALGKLKESMRCFMQAGYAADGGAGKICFISILELLE